MWEFLKEIDGGSGSFFGSLAGSFLGLAAILLGALFNARLNRRRDDRMIKQDIYFAAQSLIGELQAIDNSLDRNRNNFINNTVAAGGFQIPDPNHMILVFPVMILKLGPIGAEGIIATKDAYTMIEEFSERLSQGDASITKHQSGRDMILVPFTDTPWALSVFEDVQLYIKEAIKQLKSVPNG